jgi:hypothetical protein
MKTNVMSLLTLVIGITVPASAQNLLVNGNFSAGNSGFTTAFQDYSGSLLPAGSYSVVANPEFANIYAASFGDHTTGSGLMLAVNNNANSTAVVWGETVSVNSGTAYQFSGWGASWAYYYAPIDLSPALLRVYINGQQQAPDFQLPAADGQWLNFGLSWNSGASTQATIQIVDVNTLVGGNAFVLDDLNLHAVPEPSTIALLAFAAVLVAGRRRQNKTSTR